MIAAVVVVFNYTIHFHVLIEYVGQEHAHVYESILENSVLLIPSICDRTFDFKAFTYQWLF